MEVSLHHRANGGHGENASSPGQTLESTIPVLGQTNRSGTGFTDRDTDVRSQRLERTTHTTGRTDRSIHRGSQKRADALERIESQPQVSLQVTDLQSTRAEGEWKTSFRLKLRTA